MGLRLKGMTFTQDFGLDYALLEDFPVKKLILTSLLLILILQPFPILAQPSHLLSVKDYFPPTPGNIWVTQIAFDRGSHNYFALEVLEQFKNDSARFTMGSGPSDKYNNNDPMDFSLNWWEIKFESSQLICQGAFVTPERPFLFLSKWLNISDSTKLISQDSTVTCPIGTFYHCIVTQDSGIWAPGFGLVRDNLVYAKVNGVEYGTMPKPEVTPVNYNIDDYFPIRTGNCWIFRNRFDNRSLEGFYVMEQFKYDSLAFVLAYGLASFFHPDQPSLCATWMTIQKRPPYAVDKGRYTDEYDKDLICRPFEKTGWFIDLADTAMVLSEDSTITCPLGIFHQCVVVKTWGALAPGFGPVSSNLLYARVNGIEYGTMPTYSTVEADHQLNAPRKNSLYPAYPNPFNQSTGISFYLSKPGAAKVTVFDAQGRTVRTLLNQHAAAGSHYLTWDGMTDDRLPCPSGVYFVSLKTSAFSQKRALTLVR